MRIFVRVFASQFSEQRLQVKRSIICKNNKKTLKKPWLYVDTLIEFTTEVLYRAFYSPTERLIESFEKIPNNLHILALDC